MTDTAHTIEHRDTVTEVPYQGTADTMPQLLENTESSSKNTPRKVRSKYSRPSFNRELTVASLQAQRVLNRSLSRVAYSLFSIDVILQIIGKRENIDEVEALIKQMINETHENIVQTTKQIETLKEKNNVSQTPAYTAPKKYLVEIT